VAIFARLAGRNCQVSVFFGQPHFRKAMFGAERTPRLALNQCPGKTTPIPMSKPGALPM
jgi:hypothetical protein